jgi:hypothetical protein
MKKGGMTKTKTKTKTKTDTITKTTRQVTCPRSFLLDKGHEFIQHIEVIVRQILVHD